MLAIKKGDVWEVFNTRKTPLLTSYIKYGAGVDLVRQEVASCRTNSTPAVFVISGASRGSQNLRTFLTKNLIMLINKYPIYGNKALLGCMCLFLTNVLLSQSSRKIFVGVGGEANSRILSLSKTQLSETEQKIIRGLETIKPSLGVEIGYQIQNEGKGYYSFGIGLRHTRFGSKIYELPPAINNVTPQAPFKKNVVLQNQQYLFFEYSSEKIKFLRGLNPFFKGAIFHNNLYKFRTRSYTETKEKLFSGLTYSDSFKSHSFDLNLSIGINSTINLGSNRSLLIRPYCSVFLLQIHPIFRRKAVGNVKLVFLVG